MVLNVHRNHKAYGGGGGEYGGDEGDYIPIATLNDSCIKMDSDESHFNISVGSDGQSYKTVSTNHNLSEGKREPKRYGTEVLPLTSLTLYRQATPAHAGKKSAQRGSELMKQVSWGRGGGGGGGGGERKKKFRKKGRNL